MQPETPAPAPTEEAMPTRLAQAFVVRTPRRIWAMPLLLALNSIVFVAMVASEISWDRISATDLLGSLGELTRAATDPGTMNVLRFGGVHGPYVAHGDWWRLLSCAFVHIGFIHFVVNMAGLFALRIVESFYGSGAYLLVYLSSAVGGSLCSVLWNPSEVSAGASGALFGIAGALLAFFIAHRHSIPEHFLRPVLRNLALVLALNLFFGALLPGIDNAAHVGGLVLGLVSGRALDRDPMGSARLDARRLLRATIPAILLGLLCVLVPWRAESAKDIRLVLAGDQATRELALGHDELALHLAEDGLARDATNPALLGVRAKIHLRRGEPREALEDLSTLLYQQPTDSAMRFLRAHLYWILGRHAEALADAQLLAARNPEDLRYPLLAGELEWVLGNWREAAIAFGLVARQKSESALEGQLLLWLARCRLGEEEQATKELRHYLAAPRFNDTSALDANIGGLFAGQQRFEELVARFDRHDAPRAELRRLYFFVALWRIQRGDPDEAREFLTRAVEGGPSADEVWLLARRELERLEKH